MRFNIMVPNGYPGILWRMDEMFYSEEHLLGTVDSTSLLNDPQEYVEIQRRIRLLMFGACGRYRGSTQYIWDGTFYPHKLLPITSENLMKKIIYDPKPKQFINQSQVFVGQKRLEPIYEKLRDGLSPTKILGPQPEGPIGPREYGYYIDRTNAWFARRPVMNSNLKTIRLRLTRGVASRWPTSYSLWPTGDRVRYDLNLNELLAFPDRQIMERKLQLAHFLYDYSRPAWRNQLND